MKTGVPSMSLSEPGQAHSSRGLSLQGSVVYKKDLGQLVDLCTQFNFLLSCETAQECKELCEIQLTRDELQSLLEVCGEYITDVSDIQSMPHSGIISKAELKRKIKAVKRDLISETTLIYSVAATSILSGIAQGVLRHTSE